MISKIMVMNVKTRATVNLHANTIMQRHSDNFLDDMPCQNIEITI